MNNIHNEQIPSSVINAMRQHKQANSLDINTRNMKQKRVRIRKVEPNEFFQNMNPQQREK